MATNGHNPSQPEAVNGQSQTQSQKPWYEKHGREEYRIWQKAHPLNHISYEKWKVSKYVDGLSLYYATLRIFDESESSDEGFEHSEVESRPRSTRDESAREPREIVTANGNSLPHDRDSATILASAKTDTPNASAKKKKRKPRKKPKSQEVVASEGDSEELEATTTATTPVAPVITLNGRRKSSNRKPRKKPISEEIIPPEDEEDDSLIIDAATSPAIASPLPVRSAPGTSASKQVLEAPKKTILKLTTRKTPKKKVLSEETVHDDDSNDETTTKTTVPAAKTAQPSTIADSEHDITAALESHLVTGIDGDGDDVDVSADSTSAAATRRGLRTRRPAQQKPYSYDAQIYEDHETVLPEDNDFPIRSLTAQSRRASTFSLGKGPYEELPTEMDEETLAILQGDVDLEPGQDWRESRPKHFKGKGRAWKKEESDEDLEFEPGKKKSAKLKVKAKIQPRKKRGRPRKSNTSLSEDVIRDDSDSDAAAKNEDTSVIDTSFVTTPKDMAKKASRSGRKSALSEEIVRDDSDDGKIENEQDTVVAEAPRPEITTPEKQEEQPRNSDPNSAPTTPAHHVDEEPHTPKDTPSKLCTPKETPPKTRTPKSEPNASYTPTGEPNQSQTPTSAPDKSYTPKDEPDTSCTPTDEPKSAIIPVEGEYATTDAIVDKTSQREDDIVPAKDSASSVENQVAAVNNGGDVEELCK